MQQSNRELWLAFTAILLITIFYLFTVIMLGGVPAASEFFGHSLGILGFVLMLMTETLYTLRKRSRRARWGRMASWLQFHIFTGLVGPYLVLLHTSWKFNGLAGIVMLITGIVVASGFVGRYIYTAIPRTADGIAMEAFELEKQIRAIESELQTGWAGRPDLAPSLAQRLSTSPEFQNNQTLLILGGPFSEIRQRVQWWFTKQRMHPKTRAQATQLERLVLRRRALHRQVRSVAQARRMLALWHAFHIPIGMALFTAAFIHIGAAIYYATLLR
ncbi:MAG TPA: hypothetical protein VE136_16745 [Anaerolineales bacterium]|nr:hypothetical protein [Anaerolineales bacterium]